MTTSLTPDQEAVLAAFPEGERAKYADLLFGVVAVHAAPPAPAPVPVAVPEPAAPPRRRGPVPMRYQRIGRGSIKPDTRSSGRRKPRPEGYVSDSMARIRNRSYEVED